MSWLEYLLTIAGGLLVMWLVARIDDGLIEKERKGED
ncbi:hypothetical protein HNR62_002939 [Oceanisphaera litoralis]|nr:hypothetical protein [Oceanisphaera litoralis]